MHKHQKEVTMRYSYYISLIVLISFIVLALNSEANAQEMEDVVYLKNGSIIRGTIIELVPDSFVKIQTIGGSVFVYQMSEVIKITKEPKKINQTLQEVISRERLLTKTDKKLSTFGVKGGLNIANWSVSGQSPEEEFESRNVFGWGLFWNQRHDDSIMASRLEILYLMKGTNENIQSYYLDNTEITYIIETISIIPFLLFETSNSSSTGFFEIGPEIGVIIKKKCEITTYGITSEFDLENIASWEVVINFGLGFLIENTFHLDARYALGLTDLITDDSVEAKSSGIQIMAGFGF